MRFQQLQAIFTFLSYFGAKYRFGAHITSEKVEDFKENQHIICQITMFRRPIAIFA